MRRRPEPLTAADVRSARFQATKFREGYDQQAVDEFLERAVTALEARESRQPLTHILNRDAVLAAKFPVSKFREGYDQDQVDDFLDRIAATLDGVSAGAAQPAVDQSRRGEISVANGRFSPGVVIALAVASFAAGVLIWLVIR